MKKLTVSEMRKVEGGGFFKWLSKCLWNHAQKQTDLALSSFG